MENDRKFLAQPELPSHPLSAVLVIGVRSAQRTAYQQRGLLYVGQVVVLHGVIGGALLAEDGRRLGLPLLPA